jgi:hypothetical protein
MESQIVEPILIKFQNRYLGCSDYLAIILAESEADYST